MKGRRKKMATTWGRTTSEVAISPNLDSEGALEQALTDYWDRVCGALYRLVGDWDEAEDLALEVFYRFHREPPSAVRSLGTWLYRVATNLGLNAIRARHRRKSYEEAAGVLRAQRAASGDPVLEVERRQDRQRVRQVLSEMRPRSARILMLRYLGLSYAEIASILRVAPGSVGTLLARAERNFERRYVALEEGNATPE